MTRSHPVMACAECGPVFTEYVEKCRFCPGLPGHDVYWVDVAAGLQHLLESGRLDEPDAYLVAAAINELRTLRDTIESMQQAQGGAKRRRQEEKARRLADAIVEWEYEPNRIGGNDWLVLTRRVNDRYPNDPINPPSDETKALVAAMFAEPQEAADV